MPALLGLLPTACAERHTTTAVVAGKTVYRGMGVEEVQLEAFALDGRQSDVVATGRSGYHGSFSLRLPPGNYRLEGRGSLPQQNRGALELGGQVTVDVPSDVRRVDRVVIPLGPVTPRP